MQVYEYKVVPAPKRGLKGKGVKGAEGMFAHALSSLMNELGAEGWDYVRADTLPCEERQGLTGRSTVFHNVLVFRRAKETAAERVLPAQTEPAPPSPEVPVLTPVIAAPPATPAIPSPESLAETLRRPAPRVSPANGNRSEGNRLAAE